jgi:hypothetical protein
VLFKKSNEIIASQLYKKNKAIQMYRTAAPALEMEQPMIQHRFNPYTDNGGYKLRIHFIKVLAWLLLEKIIVLWPATLVKVKDTTLTADMHQRRFS